MDGELEFGGVVYVMRTPWFYADLFAQIYGEEKGGKGNGSCR